MFRDFRNKAIIRNNTDLNLYFCNYAPLMSQYLRIKVSNVITHIQDHRGTLFSAYNTIHYSKYVIYRNGFIDKRTHHVKPTGKCSE